jgi:CubicO group peptidase (beta-lactamase class C family)
MRILLLHCIMIALLAVPSSAAFAADKPRKTEVSIRQASFLVNGKLTYAGRVWNGHKIEGLLFNSRMVQGIFDDLNPDTVSRWAYPDTKKWDADRNTREFIAAMPAWRDHGLLAFTLNLQGGSPEGYSAKHPWHNSAFNADGSLRPDYLARLERILDKADELGMVVILGFFYFGQDERLKDEEAVTNGVDNAVDWILARGYRNILIEINNECNVARYDHEILKPKRVHELIERVQKRTKDTRRLLVGTSYGGGAIPTENVVRVSDFLLIHGNGQHKPEQITEQIRKTRKVPGYRPMPIVNNEDDHFAFEQPRYNLLASIEEYVSWGFFDFRMKEEGFKDGYQSPPVDWGLSSPRKRAFFERLREITGVGAKADPLKSLMRFPGKDWDIVKPEAEGLDADKLARAIDYLKANAGNDGVRELVIVRRGRIVWHGDDIDKVHGVWSCTKSFTSTVLGLLIDSKKCTLDTLAAEHVPVLKERYPAVTLRHFTTMTSGYRAKGDAEAKGSYLHGPSTTPFEPAERLFAPGEKYAYWDSAMNLFGLTLARIAGEPLEDILKKRIMDPISANPANWKWGVRKEVKDIKANSGSGNAGGHVQIAAREMARFGHLMLNRGKWDGKQLLSASWVEQATTVQVPAKLANAHPKGEIEGSGRYGFNWWVNGTNLAGQRKWPAAPASTFAALGHNNNRMWIIPDWQMVIVRLGQDQAQREITDAAASEFLKRVHEAIADEMPNK